MKPEELRNKNIDQLQKLSADVRGKLEQSKVDLLQDKETNLQKIRNLKKDYARILTVLNEKRSQENA